MRLYIYFLLIVPVFAFAQNQEFNTDQQYNQAMANAKLAFEAKQYSQAVMFYREAMKIKPDALLPRYKVEDIRTIYIEKELSKEPIPIAEKQKRKSKKEIELEKQIEKQKAEAEATRKMNEDADKATAELKNLNIDVIEIQESENDFQLNNSINVNDAEKDAEANLQIKATEVNEAEDDFQIENNLVVAEVEPEKHSNLEIKATEISESEDDLQISDNLEVEAVASSKKTQLQIRVIDIDEEPEKIADDFHIEEIPFAEIPKVEVKKKPAPVALKTAQPKPTQPKQMTAEEKKVWVEKENKRLVAKYPNRKTVEEIEKPGKHITRVIMNIDNKVSIYLKVHHSWGATFFFIDEVGQELRSINQQYFNLMTNLETYGP